MFERIYSSSPTRKADNKQHKSIKNCSIQYKKQLPIKNPILEEIKKRSFAKNNNCVHSVSIMTAAGLEYTGDGDNVRCKDCGFEKSGWTANMDPVQIHSSENPECSFVTKYLLAKSLPLILYTSSAKTSPDLTTTSASHSKVEISTPVQTATNIRTASVSNDQESPLKRQKIEIAPKGTESYTLDELKNVQEIRTRTFSHWPHRTTPSKAQMIDAGFFNCNVGDRVICIYCNLICQQWTPHTDDPCEVHITLSPNCIYVKAKLLRQEPGSIFIVNEASIGTASGALDQVRCNELVHTVACHGAYSELPKRIASFATWPTENLPSVDELVKAGFFYTGTKNIVTCFYCNGSLQNWGPNDNPTIEHARWFPHCAYAKQLCGDDLYRKIQESKRAQQERARANIDAKNRTTTTNNPTANSKQLFIPDESALSRLVAARLDLPISQRLLIKKFKLSIIKRCWEDQLRLKLDDFSSESDLHMACIILQKQIEHIDGKKENIIIPSLKMKKIREEAERKRDETNATSQISTVLIKSDTSKLTAESNNTEMETTTTTSQSSTNESTSSTESTSKSSMTNNQEQTKPIKSAIDSASGKDNISDTSPANPCVLCLSEEKRLACIPCGHLAACVPCGHSLRSCPICRREIEAFVRIYI